MHIRFPCTAALVPRVGDRVTELDNPAVVETALRPLKGLAGVRRDNFCGPRCRRRTRISLTGATRAGASCTAVGRPRPAHKRGKHVDRKQRHVTKFLRPWCVAADSSDAKRESGASTCTKRHSSRSNGRFTSANSKSVRLSQVANRCLLSCVVKKPRSSRAI